MVGPNGLEPSTSSVSRKRSNQTELRAYKSKFADLIVLTVHGLGKLLHGTQRLRNLQCPPLPGDNRWVLIFNQFLRREAAQ
jgi:hypothetical protein